MRILFVTSQYPPHELGGYEQLCQEAAQGLQARGHDVRVLTSRFGLKPRDARRVDNVDRSLHLTADIHYYKPLDFFLRRPAREKSNLAALKSAIDEFAPDVVMFWGMFALSHDLPYHAEKWLPGRVSYYIGSYWPLDPDLHEEYWKSPANRQVTEWIKRPLRALALAQLKREGYPRTLKFEHVLSCSEYVRDRLAEAGRLPAGAEVVYAGSDPQMFQTNPAAHEPDPEGYLWLLYFGRLVPEKGVHTAIEAIGLLKREHLAVYVKLTVMGDGHPDYKRHLLQRVAELGIADQVIFVPKVAREDIPQSLPNFDVFLFTSTWPEPFGRTIIEAMMAGLVVIGSDVGGSREIFQHYDREMLFQPGDAQGLADRIKRVLDDPKLRSRLAEAGRRLAFERFTTRRMMDGIEEFLSKVAAQAAASPPKP